MSLEVHIIEVEGTSTMSYTPITVGLIYNKKEYTVDTVIIESNVANPEHTDIEVGDLEFTFGPDREIERVEEEKIKEKILEAFQKMQQEK